MLIRYWVAIVLLVLASLSVVLYTSDGDSDADLRFRYRLCTGCPDKRCFGHCKIDSLWDQLECQNDCRNYCKEKELRSDGSVKYYGKWPFRRAIHDGKQAFASAVSSTLIFAMHIRGWSRLWAFLYHKMPLNERDRGYYDYACLWHTYGILSLNTWLWGAAFHVRDVSLAEKLHCSSTLALLAYSVFVAIKRSLKVKDIAESFVVAAPPITFVTTHIIYLQTFKPDYGWNMKVCLVLVVTELTIWGVRAGVTNQDLRWKIWMVAALGVVATLLEVSDLPSHKGLFDAHFLQFAFTIPLTRLRLDFIQDDAETLSIVNIPRGVHFQEIVNPPDPATNGPPRKGGKQGKKRK